MSTTYEASAAEIIERYEKAELEYKGAVDGVKDALVIENGYSDEDEDGNTVPDYEAMKKAGAESVTATFVRSKDDRAKIGLTAGDLFARVLPEHPDLDSANQIERDAVKSLTRFLWGITQTAPNGYVQSRLEEGLVLAQAKVHRGNDAVNVVYVTDDDELILTDRLQPDIDEFVKQAARVGAASTMIVMRRPALAAAARRAISAGNRKAASAAQPSVPELESTTSAEH
jgi:hypothetical protein